MSGNKPEVHERGGYSGGGGPEADTLSYDNRTPTGAESYRSVDDGQQQYVFGLDGGQENGPEGPFLDREKLARGDGPPSVLDRANAIDPYKLAGGGLVVVLVLGALGLWVVSSSPSSGIQPLEEIAPLEEPTAGGSTETREVDGVKVRTGMQQRALAPAIPGEDRGPLNAIPSGDRVQDPATPPADDAPTEDAPDDLPPPSDIPSGDRIGGN